MEYTEQSAVHSSEELSLLLVPNVAADGVRSHGHRACVLTLLDLTAAELPPAFRLAEPLRAVFWLCPRTLQAPQLHFPAL
jgi:hypothetical protein